MGEFVAMSVFTLLFLFGITEVQPLKNVQVIVPAAVIINDHVTLRCLYDLDHNESLYAVKWYLESTFGPAEEFYRYVPKEVPPIQAFDPMKGIVDIMKSDAHSVYLRSVRHDQSGIYKCEVSADFPGFDTDIVQAQMTVVEFTENPPLIEPGKNRYEVGERIRANCSFGPTRPAANISWFINNVQVKPQFIHELPVFIDGQGGSWVKSTVEMDTDATSFRGGRLKLKCVGSVFSVNRRSAEVQIDEEKPRSASVKAGSKDSSGNQVGHKPGVTNGLPNSVSDASSSSSSISTIFVHSFHSILFILGLHLSVVSLFLFSPSSSSSSSR